METRTIIQESLSASSFIETNKDKELIVFIIDDNLPYLNLLKKLLERPNFSVFTFNTGEECLEYLQLQPDLVIIDYHLDSVDPNAMSGDKIAEVIEQRVPKAEIILISADSKFNLISDLHLASTRNIIYKDDDAIVKIKSAGDKMVGNIHTLQSTYKIPFLIVLTGFIIENILLIFLK